jgi:quinol monooxygenase YgiN
MYLLVTRGRWDPAKHDEFAHLVPAAIAAIRKLPGCQDARNGVERSTGRTVTVSTFDTQEHAQFSRESLGEPLARLQAAGWQGEAPEIYESVP